MKETSTALEDAMNALIEGKKYSTIRDVLSTMNAADIAALMESVEEKKLPLVFRLLPKELAADTFVEMDSDSQQLLIRGFSDNELKEVVDELYVDDAADIVEEMPANVVKRILKQADPEMRKMINEVLKYPEDSAGSIMTTEYVSLSSEMTSEDAVKRIRRTGLDKETIYTCYVTSGSGRLLGFLSLKHLLAAEDEEKIGDIMDQNVIAVHTTDDQEEAAQLLQRYGFVALPVVDQSERLVGIITIDDAMDVIEEETTEDIEKMAAITPTEKEYLRTSVWEMWRSRIPWLLFLMLSATFTGLILEHNRSVLASAVELTFFLPMLMGTGGIAGGQASGTVIRSLSLGEIEFRDFFRVLWKECRVAFLSGITLAAVGFLKILIIDDVGALAALAVSLSLVATVFVSKIAGCSLPILAKKIGLDPAVLSTPIISTIVDAVSLILYFCITSAILKM